MELLDYNQALDLFTQNKVLRFLVEPETQHLRKYHPNQIITLYTKDGTYLVEARLEEREKSRKILPPKEPLRSYTCNQKECCFVLPNRKVCEKDPACLRATVQTSRQSPTEFCKIHKALCQDKYKQRGGGFLYPPPRDKNIH